MWIISVVSLSVVAALCLLGVFHRSFQDNLLQCVGMGGLCVACCGRIHWIWTTEMTVPSWMLVHLCVAIYAVGTAHKVALKHGRASGWKWLARFDLWVLERQTQSSTFDSRPHHHWGAR